ncbi:MAG: amidohydrolase [Acidimicrobiia bacterium]|nr:amidohydrolase [Acidimicrobiia bacterium]
MGGTPVPDVADLELISVDDHVVEPPHVWQERLPAAMRERGPKIVRKPERGIEFWVYEDRKYATIGLNAVAGRPKEEYNYEPTRYDQMRSGCYDPKARVEDMDVDGVTASLNFPSFARFCGQTFLESDDRDLALACVRAYNDWMIEEWCATAPARFIPLTIAPLWDPALMAAEVERTAALGSRAVAFSEEPSKLGLPSLHSEHWDPFFAACEETSTVVCTHIGSSSNMPTTSPDAPMQVGVLLTPANAFYTATDLVFSPIFRRFPDLRWALSEGGIGWVPYFLERLERTADRHGAWLEIPSDPSPREIFDRNIWVCFIDDEVGLEQRHKIGVDKIMWECDYPHADSNWPHSGEYVRELTAGIPEAEVRAMCSGNARALFGFDA